jgi:hypothetical protein
MTDPSFYGPLARAAEDAGFDSFVVPDSIAYPRESDSVYPFNPDGTREFLEDKPFIEPFFLVGALRMVTERIRLGTFGLVAEVRRPQVSGIDVRGNLPDAGVVSEAEGLLLPADEHSAGRDEQHPRPGQIDVHVSEGWWLVTLDPPVRFVIHVAPPSSQTSS